MFNSFCLQTCEVPVASVAYTVKCDRIAWSPGEMGGDALEALVLLL